VAAGRTAFPVVDHNHSSPAAAVVRIEAEAAGHSSRLLVGTAVDGPSPRIRGAGIAAVGLDLAWGKSVMPPRASAGDQGREMTENARVCWPWPMADCEFAN
jgi:hypothetical protein